VVLRHITDPAVIETIEYADQQKDKGEGNGRGKSIFYVIGQNDVIPGQHAGKNNTPRPKSESSRIVILRKPEEADFNTLEIRPEFLGGFLLSEQSNYGDTKLNSRELSIMSPNCYSGDKYRIEGFQYLSPNLFC
jgi:hypothetical protein